MVETFILIVAGFFSGIVSGMTGASGVMVMIPFLTTFFGLPIYVAIGTSLLADVISSGPISYTYFKNKNLDFKTGLLLGGSAVLGAQVAVENLKLLPENLVVFGIAIFMVGLGLRLWRDGIAKKETKPPAWLDIGLFKNPRLKMIITVILGFLLGLMTGFFGAGGGLLIFLVLYFILKLDLKTSIGTAAFVMIMSSFSGAFGHWRMGNLDLQVGLIIGFSATIGGVFSAYLANRFDESSLSKTVGAIFIFLAILMLGIRIIG